MNRIRNVYDPENAKEHFCLPSGFEDAFGKRTGIEYDDYDLLIASIDDPLGNKVSALNEMSNSLVLRYAAFRNASKNADHRKHNNKEVKICVIH